MANNNMRRVINRGLRRLAAAMGWRSEDVTPTVLATLMLVTIMLATTMEPPETRNADALVPSSYLRQEDDSSPVGLTGYLRVGADDNLLKT